MSFKLASVVYKKVPGWPVLHGGSLCPKEKELQNLQILYIVLHLHNQVEISQLCLSLLHSLIKHKTAWIFLL